MDVKDMRCVNAIADTGSFVRAAEKLNMSQPSVSARMRTLEANLGAKLFVREPRGVVLTPEGEELLVHARRILLQFREAEDDLAAFQRSPVGLVRLGLPTSLTASLAVPLLEQCQAELPNVKLRIVESMSGYLAQWLREEKIDFALTFGASAPDLNILPLAREALLLVGCNAAAVAGLTDDDGAVPLRCLANIPLILPGPEHGLRTLIEDQARQQAVPLNVKIEIDALGEIRRLVASDMGYTIMSSAAYADAGFHDLGAALIRRPSISRVINLATLAGRAQSRALKAVSQFVQLAVEDLVDQKEHFYGVSE